MGLLHTADSAMSSIALAVLASVVIVFAIIKTKDLILQYLYLICGPRIIQNSYISAAGNPFKVPTPSNNLLMVSTNEHLREVNAASLRQLSLHAIAKDLLQPEYTIPSFVWQDQRHGVEGSGYVRAVRGHLTSHLPVFQSTFESIIESTLEKELGTTSNNEWSSVKLFPMMKRIVTKLNCFVFFGEELLNNDEFLTAALDFPQSTFMAAELLRNTPHLLCPLVVNMITRGRWAEKTLIRYLTPIVQESLDKRPSLGGEVRHDAPANCVQWIIDMTPRKDPWPASRIIGQILSLWFAAVFQPAMTASYAVEDLCLHTDHVEPLRDEIRRSEEKPASRDVEALPLLDSFLRESVRMTNSDAVSIRRKAVEPFAFSDGTTMQKGDWVCVPMAAMMHDPQRYRDPESFDGYRFLNANEHLRQGLATANVPEKSPLKFTDVDLDWPIWGHGQMSCPGRWYASMILKLLMVRIIDNYDCKMPKKPYWRSFCWRTGMVPRDNTVAMFRKIQDSA